MDVLLKFCLVSLGRVMERVGESGFIKDRQPADLDVIPFCAADALWGSVAHTFGFISEHVGSGFGAGRAL